MPFANLRPNATGDHNSWTLGAGATKQAAVDPGEYPGTHDGDTSYIRVIANPGSGNTHQSFLLGTRPKMASVVALLYRIRARHETIGEGVESIFVFARLDGVDGTAAAVAPGTGYTDYSGALSRPGGGPWSVADVENPSLQICVSVPTDNGDPARVTTLWIELEYVPADPGDGREIATAALRIRRRPIRYSGLQVGPAIFDAELMDDLSLSHYAHPLTTILGSKDVDGNWRPGHEGWQRVLVQHREIETDLNTLQSTIAVRDRRSELTSFFDSAESRRSPASIEDGVAILTMGVKRVYSRGSKAWLEDPASGLVVKFDPNQRPIGLNGYQPENFANQWLYRSSFVSGTTGLTYTGPGSITAEANPPEPLFHSDVVPSSQCLKITAGNPHNADGVVTWPDSPTITANTILRYSIDHRDDSGAALEWQLRRGSDGRYWDDASGAWLVAVTWNTLGVQTTRKRDKSLSRINVGTSNTIISHRLRQASGGTASRVNRVYHVQLEDNGVGHVTSRIVTDAAAPVARAVQAYTVEDLSAKRSLNPGYGTFFCLVRPSWDAFDMNVSGNFPPVFERRYDANNYWILYYDGAAANTLRFEVKVAGVASSSFLTFTPDAGAEYVVAARWLGPDAAFGYPARSFHLFAGPQGSILKGSDPVRSADPTVADGLLYIGTSATGVAWNGVIRRVWFTPQLFSDAEIQAGRW